jgi:hypothetical protein
MDNVQKEKIVSVNLSLLCSVLVQKVMQAQFGLAWSSSELSGLVRSSLALHMGI